MTTISRSALVMHTAEQMFDLVNDVRAYPQFLNGCKATEVLEEGEDFMLASMLLAKAGLEQKIITRNELVRPQSLDMKLIEGPFSKFSGIWRFQALSDDACKVTLDMEFEVSSRIASIALSALFKQV